MVPNGTLPQQGNAMPNGNLMSGGGGSLMTPGNVMNQVSMVTPSTMMNHGGNMGGVGNMVSNAGNLYNTGGGGMMNNYDDMLQDFDDPSANFGMNNNNNMNRHGMMGQNRGPGGANMNHVNTWRDNMNPMRRMSRDTIRDMYAEVEGYGMDPHI